ncbi:MAG: hypothetical protein V1740_02830 [Candidatus Woesearchaeota archaeon]
MKGNNFSKKVLLIWMTINLLLAPLAFSINEESSNKIINIDGSSASESSLFSRVIPVTESEIYAKEVIKHKTEKLPLLNAGFLLSENELGLASSGSNSFNNTRFFFLLLLIFSAVFYVFARKMLFWNTSKIILGLSLIMIVFVIGCPDQPGPPDIHLSDITITNEAGNACVAGTSCLTTFNHQVFVLKGNVTCTGANCISNSIVADATLTITLPSAWNVTVASSFLQFHSQSSAGSGDKLVKWNSTTGRWNQNYYPVTIFFISNKDFSDGVISEDIDLKFEFLPTGMPMIEENVKVTNVNSEPDKNIQFCEDTTGRYDFDNGVSSGKKCCGDDGMWDCGFLDKDTLCIGNDITATYELWDIEPDNDIEDPDVTGAIYTIWAGLNWSTITSSAQINDIIKTGTQQDFSQKSVTLQAEPKDIAYDTSASGASKSPEGNWAYANATQLEGKIIDVPCGNYSAVSNKSDWIACTGDQLLKNCILSLSDTTNAHIGECGEYEQSFLCEPPRGYELSCELKNSDCGNSMTEIMRLSGTTNAHGEILGPASQNYNTRVCCSLKPEDGGNNLLGTGNNQISLLRLSNETNAHAQVSDTDLCCELGRGVEPYDHIVNFSSSLNMTCTWSEYLHKSLDFSGKTFLDTSNPLNISNHDYLCHIKGGYPLITECCGTEEVCNSTFPLAQENIRMGPSRIIEGVDYTQVATAGENLTTYGDISYYCTQDGKWVQEFDDAGKLVCEGQGWTWIGNGSLGKDGYCCGDDPEEYSMFNFSAYTDLSNASNPGKACWNATSVSNYTYVMFGLQPIKSMFNNNGIYYGCSIGPIDVDGNGTAGDARDIELTNLILNGSFTNYSEIDDLNGDGTHNESDAEIVVYFMVQAGYIFLQDYNTDENLVGSNGTRNMDYCRFIPGDEWFCDYPTTWRNKTEADIRGLREPGAEPYLSDGIPGERDYQKLRGCCPEDYCWNQADDVCVSGDIEDMEDSTVTVGEDEWICVYGEWKTPSELTKRDWDGDPGYCEQEDQCVSININNKDEGINFCVNTGEFIEDHICNGGNWTTRTRYVALELLNYTDTNDNFTLFCDDYQNLIPYLKGYKGGQGGGGYQIEDLIIGFQDQSGSLKFCTSDNLSIGSGQRTAAPFSQFYDGQRYKGLLYDQSPRIPCINNFCVLRKNPNTNNENVTFGFSYNFYPTHLDPAFNIVTYLGNLSGQFSQVPGQNIIIYHTNAREGGLPAPFLQLFYNLIDWIIGLFVDRGDPISLELPNNTQKLYYSHTQQGDEEAEIYGFVDNINFSAEKYMYVSYIGYPENIGKLAYESNLLNITTGNNQMLYTTTNLNDVDTFWSPLTAMLRPGGMNCIQECAVPGQLSCVGISRDRQECKQNDNDPCYELADIDPCSADEICIDGQCELCAPKDCADYMLENNCGSGLSDMCGNTIDCSDSCQSGQYCNASDNCEYMCRDTDGGDYPNTYGQVTVINPVQDTTVRSDDCMEIKSDRWIRESVCDAGDPYFNLKDYACEHGCENDACRSQSPNTDWRGVPLQAGTCRDSDGDDAYTKGYTQGFYGSETNVTTFVDFCVPITQVSDPIQVLEGTCITGGSYIFEARTCGAGEVCTDGRCVSGLPAEVDTDGDGLNDSDDPCTDLENSVFESSTLLVNGVPSVSRGDNCVIGTSVVQSCTAADAGCSVREGICLEGNAPQTIKAPCPFGCNNRACVLGDSDGDGTPDDQEYCVNLEDDIYISSPLLEYGEIGMNTGGEIIDDFCKLDSGSATSCTTEPDCKVVDFRCDDNPIITNCPNGCTDGACNDCLSDCGTRQCGLDICGDPCGSCYSGGVCVNDLYCATGNAASETVGEWTSYYAGNFDGVQGADGKSYGPQFMLLSTKTNSPITNNEPHLIVGGGAGKHYFCNNQGKWIRSRKTDYNYTGGIANYNTSVYWVNSMNNILSYYKYNYFTDENPTKNTIKQGVSQQPVEMELRVDNNGLLYVFYRETTTGPIKVEVQKGTGGFETKDIPNSEGQVLTARSSKIDSYGNLLVVSYNGSIWTLNHAPGSSWVYDNRLVSKNLRDCAMGVDKSVHAHVICRNDQSKLLHFYWIDGIWKELTIDDSVSPAHGDNSFSYEFDSNNILHFVYSDGSHGSVLKYRNAYWGREWVLRFPLFLSGWVYKWYWSGETNLPISGTNNQFYNPKILIDSNNQLHISVNTGAYETFAVHKKLYYITNGPLNTCEPNNMMVPW